MSDLCLSRPLDEPIIILLTIGLRSNKTSKFCCSINIFIHIFNCFVNFFQSLFLRLKDKKDALFKFFIFHATIRKDMFKCMKKKI